MKKGVWDLLIMVEFFNNPDDSLGKLRSSIRELIGRGFKAPVVPA